MKKQSNKESKPVKKTEINKPVEKNKPTPPVINDKKVTLTPQRPYENLIVFAIILVLSFVSYSNTIMYDYVLDDKAVITNNQFTKKGLAGIKEVMTGDIFMGIAAKNNNYVAGGRYRPLSLVMFAVEWHFFPNNPHVNHFINILLYALTCFFIYLVLVRLLSRHPAFKPENVQNNKWLYTVPFVTAVLFLVHPLHTEAVANIKGRDEIMTFLGSLITIWFTMKFIDTQKAKYLVFSFIAFFLALLSKENAITFLAVIPLTIYYFTQPNKKNQPVNGLTYIATFAPMLLATIVFLILRQQVVGDQSVTGESTDLMNNPFLGMTFLQKYGTIFYTLGLYIKLLFIPYPLTFDYYPYHIPIIQWYDFRAIVPLLFYISIGFVALVGLKKKTIISYSIWFYLITLSIVSNVFIPIGAFMSERFLFISSLGFCLIVAYIVVEKLPVWLSNVKPIKIVTASFIAVIALIFIVMTITRNRVWKDEFTLFTTDVKVSVEGAKANYAAGFAYVNESKKPEMKDKRKEYFETGVKYLEKAIEIHPGYENVLVFLANNLYEYDHQYEKPIEYYKQVAKIYPTYDRVFQYVVYILSNDTLKIDPDYKIKKYEEFYQINPKRFDLTYNLGILYFNYKQDNDKAIFYMEQAVKITPNVSDGYKVLGVCYGRRGELQKSIEMFNQAIKINPQDKQLYRNLGLVYQQMGNKEMAANYFKLAQ